MTFRDDVPWLTWESGPEVWAEYHAEDARHGLFPMMSPWLWSRHDRDLTRIPGPLAEC